MRPVGCIARMPRLKSGMSRKTGGFGLHDVAESDELGFCCEQGK